MKYADVSEANLYYGNMRFDVNVSVSKTDELGTRTETKNLNSFKSVEKAVEYEVERQIEELEKGNKIVQETRGWLDDKQKTVSQRSKEEAHDYRYMPDPDIPPVVLDDAYIESIKADMPALPDDYRQVLADIGIDAKTISDIVAVPDTAMTVKRIYGAANASHAKRVAFWLLSNLGGNSEEVDNDRPPMSTQEVVTVVMDDERLIKLSQMVEDNKLSSTAAKGVFNTMVLDSREPEIIAGEKNLLQVSDEGEIAKIVAQVLDDNEQAANDVKNGEMKAIGFLVGQVMKASKGKANPALAQELIKKQLGL
jgi:aspartyl-tRNA(Asn)/glutamyl-tRNA(Gln) amidotransferase subunit B